MVHRLLNSRNHQSSICDYHDINIITTICQTACLIYVRCYDIKRSPTLKTVKHYVPLDRKGCIPLLYKVTDTPFHIQGKV